MTEMTKSTLSGVEGSEQYAIDEEVSVNPLLEHLHFFDHQGNRLVA